VNSRIDDYNTFQDLLEKYRGCSKIKDAEYLRRQHWVEWVIEHRAKNQMYTKYIFYGLQGTQETCYQERHEDQEAGVFTKAYKD
jgi:predicted DNA-binding protein (MmcQ/YjbR family)